MKIGDVAGDQLTLDVEPGAGADAIPAPEIGAPCASGVWSAQGLSLSLAQLVGAGEPAKIARLIGIDL
jgi:hypothetical protein